MGFPYTQVTLPYLTYPQAKSFEIDVVRYLAA